MDKKLADLDLSKTDYLHIQLLPNIPSDVRESFVRDVAAYVEKAALAMGAWCYPSQSGQQYTLYLELTATERHARVELTDGQTVTMLEQIAEREGTTVAQILREAAKGM